TVFMAVPLPLGCPWRVTRDLPPGRTQVWDRHPSSTKIATRSLSIREREVDMTRVRPGHSPSERARLPKRLITLDRRPARTRPGRQGWVARPSCIAYLSMSFDRARIFDDLLPNRPWPLRADQAISSPARSCGSGCRRTRQRSQPGTAGPTRLVAAFLDGRSSTQHLSPLTRTPSADTKMT